MTRKPIPFNVPALVGGEAAYLEQAIASRTLAGGGPFSERCSDWLEDRFGAPALMVTSCTAALEMAAMLCGLDPGDEVILPSFAFTSTATAFAREGAALRFVDVEPGTMTIDPVAVEAAITARTRVIVVLHYGGIACDMAAIGALAEKHDLLVVEDAAHAVLGRFDERALGTIGTFGCLSFHESKNIHCGEGGALLVNDPAYLARAEVLLEKGTDRRRFFRGEVDRYTWQDVGSSYVLSDLNCAFLLAQLEAVDDLTAERVRCWQAYHERLAPLAEAGRIETARVPGYAQHNGHICWIKLADDAERDGMIAHLRERGVSAHFHYVPLHSAPAGQRYGRFVGDDRHTSSGSERLLRLPIHQGFDRVEEVVSALEAFFSP